MGLVYREHGVERDGQSDRGNPCPPEHEKPGDDQFDDRGADDHRPLEERHVLYPQRPESDRGQRLVEEHHRTTDGGVEEPGVELVEGGPQVEGDESPPDGGNEPTEQAFGHDLVPIVPPSPEAKRPHLRDRQHHQQSDGEQADEGPVVRELGCLVPDRPECSQAQHGEPARTGRPGQRPRHSTQQHEVRRVGVAAGVAHHVRPRRKGEADTKDRDQVAAVSVQASLRCHQRNLVTGDGSGKALGSRRDTFHSQCSEIRESFPRRHREGCRRRGLDHRVPHRLRGQCG